MKARVSRFSPRIAAWACVTLIPVLQAQPSAAQIPDAALDDRARSVTALVTAAGGYASRGAAGTLGGQLGVGRWIVDARFLKTTSSDDGRGGSTQSESFSEHYALLAGRTFGAKARSSVSAGIARSKSWKEVTTRHQSPSGGSWTTRESFIDADGAAGAALAARSRTGSFLGILALNAELAAIVGDATTVGLSVGLDVGRMR